MITDDELRQVMPNCAPAKRADYLPFIQQAMQEFELQLPAQAAFLPSWLMSRLNSATWKRLPQAPPMKDRPGQHTTVDGKRYSAAAHPTDGTGPITEYGDLPA